MRSLILLIFTLITFSACQEDTFFENTETLESTVNKQFPAADQRLWSYFEAFEREAAERGLDYDLVDLGIVGVIEEISEEHVAGTCTFGGSDPHLVRIDRTFWNNSTPIIKEFIIFHELGHCVLLRDHLEACDPNGFYISLMRSGLGDCRDNYTANTRERYTDELFLEMD